MSVGGELVEMHFGSPDQCHIMNTNVNLIQTVCEMTVKVFEYLISEG